MSDTYCPICGDSSKHEDDFSWLRHMRLFQPYRVEYLTKMFDNNVGYWPDRTQWERAFQYEILDRNLIVKDSVEHRVLLEIMENAK